MAKSEWKRDKERNKRRKNEGENERYIAMERKSTRKLGKRGMGYKRQGWQHS